MSETLMAITTVALIQVYWLSLSIVGYAAFVFVQFFGRYLLRAGPKHPISVPKNLHPIIRLLGLFLAGFSLLGVLSILFYICRAPAVSITIAYIILLVIGLGYAVRHAPLKMRGRISWHPRTMRWSSNLAIKRIVALTFLCLLILDFGMALYVKSYAHNSADTYVHLARIESLATDGFSLAGGFFQNINDNIYNFNVIYPLYLPPAQLLQLQPFQIWEYSSAFFRMLQWLAIFSLASVVARFTVTKSRDRSLIPYLVSIFAIAAFGLRFSAATYPNNIANIWIITIVIALMIYSKFRTQAIILLMIGAFMLTFTHATYALMVAIFIIGYVAIRAALNFHQLLEEREWLIYGCAVIILMIGPLISFALATPLTQAQLEMFGFPTAHLGPFIIRDPVIGLRQFWSNWFYECLTGIGSVYVLVKSWKAGKRLFSLMASLILFNLIISYVPGVLTVLNTQLPLWLIDRFSAMNVLVFVTPVFGCIVIVTLISRLGKLYPAVVQKGIFRNFVLFTVILGISIVPGINTYRAHLGERAENKTYYALMEAFHSQFSPYFKDNVNILASAGDSYLLGAVLPVDVLAIEEGHTNPEADPTNRTICSQYVMDHLDYADLRALDIRYILFSNYDARFEAKTNLAQSKDYLKPLNTTGVNWLYKLTDVPQNGQHQPMRACAIIARKQ